ncbi:MAG TPA: selenocysteine-specific translation elongation factor [Patescibacteria group bacterium]|nr:selenocysteine-specific translation elongation factor [Patescibacteria group bacterium]
MPTVVVGTAGHIDHGKTALLRALTGIDADRLPEEQARGMTIDVGYAHLAFDDGVELDFVDVPGHDRLIGNMLVGAGEIDAAMLVVAADDGPRPQTLEHLQLLDALGIADGVVVITKADLVEPTRVGAVTAEVRELLRPTSLAAAEILAASAVTGAGINELRQTLRRTRDRVVERGMAGPVRLAIDRVFTSKGRGLVVTGTLRGGSLRAGETLRHEPGGEGARVRELQVHGTPREQHDGGRTALNLAGATADQLHRGDVLTVGYGVRGTDRILVGQPTTARPIGRRWLPKAGSALRLHLGTDQVDARVRRVTGVDGFAILDLERPVATFEGDRGLLREPGRGEVLGGVRVLDTSPPRGVSRRRMTPSRLEALAVAVATGSIEAIERTRILLHGSLATDLRDDVADDAPTMPRSVRFAPDVEAALADVAIETVAAHHRDAPLSPGLPLARARGAVLRRLRSLATVERRDRDATEAAISRMVDALVAEGRLARRGDALRDSSRLDDLPAPLLAAMDRLEAALAVPAPEGLTEAAAAAGCPPDGVRALQADGRIVRVAPDLAWAAATFHALAASALAAARIAPLTPAAFRDATGTSRKYVVAILEDLDRRGILERTPEGHIPGPRAPRLDPVAVEAS